MSGADEITQCVGETGDLIARTQAHAAASAVVAMRYVQPSRVPQHLHSGVNEVEVRRRPDWEVGELTGGEAPVGSDLQLLDLLDQLGDVLQEVRVLLQQPLNSELRVVPSACLHRQLLLENVDLRKPACTS